MLPLDDGGDVGDFPVWTNPTRPLVLPVGRGSAPVAPLHEPLHDLAAAGGPFQLLEPSFFGDLDVAGQEEDLLA